MALSQHYHILKPFLVYTLINKATLLIKKENKA